MHNQISIRRHWNTKLPILCWIDELSNEPADVFFASLHATTVYTAITPKRTLPHPNNAPMALVLLKVASSSSVIAPRNLRPSTHAIHDATDFPCEYHGKRKNACLNTRICSFHQEQNIAWGRSCCIPPPNCQTKRRQIPRAFFYFAYGCIILFKGNY